MIIKYGVWFHGSKHEHCGLCYSGRVPYINSTEGEAAEYSKYLSDQANESEKHLFSVCKIIIEDTEENT